MKACGVIVEYNPFHNGHRYHIKQARQQSGADVIIAVMSGNFLQRGEPAVIDKWQRAQAALANGVDLVVELPFAWSVQSADYFAKGGIKLLQSLGCESFCFGTDSPKTVDYEAFGRFVQIHQEQIDAAYRQLKQPTISYPQQMAAVFKQLCPEMLVDFAAPNHILGLSYAKENAAYQQPMKIYPIKRQKAHYHEQQISGSIASATAIRQALFANQIAAVLPTVPPSTVEQLQNSQLISWQNYWPLLQYKLLSTSAAALRENYQISEGLEYRLKKAAGQAKNFSGFINAVKSKRYTWARLQRLAVYLLVNVTYEEVTSVWTNSYLHLLGFTKQGKQYLNAKKQQLRLPLISRVSKKNQTQLALDIRSDQIYQLGNPTLKEQNFGRNPQQIFLQ
ncbi:nucleotidyltransferase [Enterococcus faecalis]